MEVYKQPTPPAPTERIASLQLGSLWKRRSASWRLSKLLLPLTTTKEADGLSARSLGWK